jgi:hypothetical protein
MNQPSLDTHSCGTGTKILLSGAFLVASSLAGTFFAGPLYLPMQTSGTKAVIHMNGLPESAVTDGELVGLITCIEHCGQPESLDEDELPPPPPVKEEAKKIISAAADLLPDMPAGKLGTFWGEVNVTWRLGDELVRLACFPDRTSIVQVGSLDAPMGSYRSEPASPEVLAARLEELFENAT